jgi:hypothetical protein
LNGAVSVSLTPKRDNPTFGGSTTFLTGSKGTFSNPFQQVPFGTGDNAYTLTLVLPKLHFGTPANMTCDPIVAKDPVPRECTATIEVPDTTSDDVAATYDLHEAKINFKPSAGRKVPTDGRVAPIDVTLTVTRATKAGTDGSPIYDAAATVGSGLTLWVPDNNEDELKYVAAIDAGSSHADWSGGAEISDPAGGKFDWGTLSIPLNQTGGFVTFTVVDKDGNALTKSASITVTNPDVALNDLSPAVTSATGTLTVELPVGTGYSVTAAADTGDSVPVPFDVNSTTCAAATPCAYTIKLP